jgi:hypothetical protein
MQLSQEALDALINTGTSRQGATIPETTSDTVVEELLKMGMIGVAYGLTRQGSIVRQAEMYRRLDIAF